MRTSSRLVILAAAVLALAAPSLAMFVRYETERVPIERIQENLARRLAASPDSVELHYQLARLHAMAATTKPGFAPPVYKSVREGQRHADTATGYLYFYPASDDGTARSNNEWTLPMDRWKEENQRHLAEALDHFEAAIRLMRAKPDAKVLRSLILRTQLGYSWCLEQAGRKTEAIESYRVVLRTAWAAQVLQENEDLKAGWVRRWLDRDFPKDLRMVDPQRADLFPVSFVEEAIACLLRLLDPVKDAAEIARLKAAQRQLEAVPRAVSPILVPLRDAPLEELVRSDAAVRFDLDGSGLPRRWGWITPDAAWLVHDPEGHGQITSGLQMFGNVTFWIRWEDGYAALAALDDNDDGELTGAELRDLALWHDANGNGVSEPGEVKPLAFHGIVALACSGTRVRDDLVRSDHGVRYSDGRTRPTYDWFAPMAAETPALRTR